MAGIALLIAVTASGAVGAQEEQHEESAAHGGAHAEAGHDAHHFHANHIAGFLGGTRDLDERKALGFTFGFDYERRFSEKFGAIARVDFVSGEHERSSLVMVGVTWHPVGGLRFALGPGIEHAEELEAEHHGGTRSSGGHGGASSHNAFVIALGAEYMFHFGNWSAGPAAWLDFLGESQTNFVFGLAFGVGF